MAAAEKARPGLGEMVRRYSFVLRLQRALARAYRDRLTPRGQFLLWTLSVFALVGLDTRRSQVFILFAAAAGLFALAAPFALLARPRVRLSCRLPARATARTPVTVALEVQSQARRPLPDLRLVAPQPASGEKAGRPGIAAEPAEAFLALAPQETVGLNIRLTPRARGRYLLRGPRVSATDPLRLMTTAPAPTPEEVLLVYPRFYTLEQFAVPVGRRYQPGGIPLSSNLGDSIEFVGTREYREGDPLRSIHWRSWARRGEPVVKEFQEEYFCRIALILDTFLPAPPKPRDLAGFEAAISVLASIADHFSRSEYIVDILAAGPDVYEVSAGRSLAYLENILDVLACLEPCHDPPFERIGPHLFEKLAQLTTVVAVLTDWDDRRQDFLRRVKALGTMVQALIVHDGETSRAWAGAQGALGALSQMTVADVERLLERASAPAAGGTAGGRP